MKVSIRSLSVFVLFAQLGPFASNLAFADDSVEIAGASGDPAARELFAEARLLAKSGNYLAACPKFEESERLQPGLGTLLNLADCWEHIGRTASAWARYLDVAALAARARQPDREQIARERAAALEPLLARLSLHVVSQPNVRVMRDGVELREALWDFPAPVDPGEHVLEASAFGMVPWRKVIVVKPLERAEWEVPRLEPEPPAAPAPAGRSASPKATRSAAVSRIGSHQVERARIDGAAVKWRKAGYACSAVGLVLGVTVGTYAGLQALDKKRDSGPGCVARCPEIRDQAQTYGNVSTVAFGVAAAGVVVAVALWLTAPNTMQSAPASAAAAGSDARAPAWVYSRSSFSF